MNGAGSLGANWQRLTRERPRGGWWWLSQSAHQGDLYAMCTLAGPFRRVYGRTAPLRLVLGEKSRVTELFEGHFDEIIYAPELNGSVADWATLRPTTGLDSFGPDKPILLFPTNNPDTWFLEQFATDNHVPWIQIYKHILRLPPATRPEPGRSDRLRDEAAALCRDGGVTEGGSVVFSPYARSWSVDARPHFEHLAEVLKHLGFAVFTGCAPNEEPIAGTRRLAVPLPMMLYVSELAGWFVGVRSGVCDIVSSASCSKTVIFGARFPLELWGLDRAGFCDDAHQINFEFAHRTPAEFVSLVLDRPDRGRAEQLRLAALAVREPTTLNAIIGMGQAFGGPGHREAIKNRGLLTVQGLRLTEGWWDLEPWGVWGRGSSHTMEISFEHPPREGFALEIAVQPMAAGSPITIEIDGLRCGRSDASTGDAHVITAHWAGSPDLHSTTFLVTMAVQRASNPHELSDGAVLDSRQIGTGFLWIKIVPGSIAT